METETYSTVDRLSNKAKSMFGASDSTPAMLTFVIVLSGILSALFFWQFSKTVFAGVYPIFAIVLGLLVGLAPSEGAYFGWRQARGSKTNLTHSQLTATRYGLIASVITSMFSTFALFVATVPFVPVEIQQYAEWLVFIALSIPIMVQFAVVAFYELNERSTVENFENAKLDAMGFDAFIRFEMARKMAVIEASNQHLERQIEAYADIHGADEIKRLLDGNSTKSIGTQETAVQPRKTPRYHLYVNGEAATMTHDLEAMRGTAKAMAEAGTAVSILDTDTHIHEEFPIPNLASPNGRG